MTFCILNSIKSDLRVYLIHLMAASCENQESASNTSTRKPDPDI